MFNRKFQEENELDGGFIGRTNMEKFYLNTENLLINASFFHFSLFTNKVLAKIQSLSTIVKDLLNISSSYMS